MSGNNEELMSENREINPAIWEKDPNCDHCGTIHRVKTWEINAAGYNYVHICWLCATKLVKLQQELKEWVD